MRRPPVKIYGHCLGLVRRFLRAHERAPLEKSGAKNLAAAVAGGRTGVELESDARARVRAESKDGATQSVQARGGGGGGLQPLRRRRGSEEEGVGK